MYEGALDGGGGGYQLRAMAAGKPRYLNAEELERFYSQISEGAVVDRAWDYFKSLL